MRLTDLFPSQFAAAADLKGKTRIVTIQKLAVEEVGQERERRGVLYFEEDEKPVILNKTNFGTLEESFGDSENWAGRPIELFAIPTTYMGKPVQGLRVRVPAEPDADELVDDSPPPPATAGANSDKKKPAAPAPDPVESLDDEIPF